MVMVRALALASYCIANKTVGRFEHKGICQFQGCLVTDEDPSRNNRVYFLLFLSAGCTVLRGKRSVDEPL